MTRFVVLGAGTAGTTLANRLARRHADDVASGRSTITVVDRDDEHLYQPGLLMLPFGELKPRQLVRSRRAQLRPGIRFVQAVVDRVDVAADEVRLERGDPLPYDVLVIATGARLLPGETEGLTGPGWRERVFDFYSLGGAVALHDALARFDHGRLVVNVIDMPIKCPVAPLEFAFLADAFFTRRGVRHRVEIRYVTPLDGAFTKPVASAALAHLLSDKRIEVVPDFVTARVDGARGVLSSWDGREEPFDLLVTVPLHGGAEFVSRSPGLGDELGFVNTEHATLQASCKPNVFAIGDATNLGASKAGAVAHFEAEVLERNVECFVAGRPLDASFDGHSNCFIETGFGRALLIDFNEAVEPLPGRFPIPRLGPLALLEETRVNHWAKLAFRWAYWHLVLPGHPIPGVTPMLSMRGKRRPA